MILIIWNRYAHTSHVVDNTLILIGGANYNEQPPGICMINLLTKQAVEFKLPVCFTFYKNNLKLI